MAILGLPAIGESLVRRCRAAIENLIKEAYGERYDQNPAYAWATCLGVDTDAIIRERQLPEMGRGAMGIVWNEPCLWFSKPETPVVFGEWFFENWQDPLSGLIIFSLTDRRVRNEDTVEIQWRPKSNPPELQCKVVRGDNINYEADGETYHHRHEMFVEVAVIKADNPPMCVGYSSRYLSSVHWSVLGETEHYLWWHQCQQLLRWNWLKVTTSAKEKLRELVEQCPSLAKQFNPDKVSWPLNEQQIHQLLATLGYKEPASRRLLRVAWAESGNETPPLMLTERTLEIRADKGELQQNVSDTSMEPITLNQPSFESALPITQACLLTGVGCRPWERMLLEAVVEVLDAFQNIKDCLPGLQEICRLGGGK